MIGHSAGLRAWILDSDSTLQAIVEDTTLQVVAYHVKIQTPQKRC